MDEKNTNHISQDDEEQLLDNKQSQPQQQQQEPQQQSDIQQLQKNTQDDEINQLSNDKQALIEQDKQIDLDNSNNLKKVTFDQILQNIGIGKYQLFFYIILSTLGITEGAQITIFTIMIPILKNEWNIEDYLNSLSASLIFFGFLIGSLISGQISDRYGRKQPFLFSTLLTVAVIIATAFSQNIYQLIVLRTLMGIIIGFFGPLAMTLLTELTPQNVRGRYMSLIVISVNIGLLFGVVLAYFILDSISAGNWRALILWSALPGVLAYVGAVIFIDESPRYCMVANNYDETFSILNRISIMNGGRVLTDNEKIQLEQWGKKVMNTGQVDEEKASIVYMFIGNLKLITPLIWTNWFNLAFIYYGIIVMLPTLLAEIKLQEKVVKQEHENESDFGKLAISSLSEMFAAGLAALLIDQKGFGRKNSLIIFYMLSSICCIFAYFDTLDRFVFWATISKFFITMNFIFIYQYTAEIYNTKIRTTGIGMANGIGKIGGVIMPWVCLMLASINLILPFLLFAFQCLTVALLNFLLPYDTLGRELDG